jgi:hypothetical protein
MTWRIVIGGEIFRHAPGPTRVAITDRVTAGEIEYPQTSTGVGNKTEGSEKRKVLRNYA